MYCFSERCASTAIVVSSVLFLLSAGACIYLTNRLEVGSLLWDL